MRELRRPGDPSLLLKSFCGPDCRICRSEIPLFANLPEEMRDKIFAIADHKVYERGEAVVHEGDRLQSLFVLHGGSLKLNHYDKEGRESIYDILYGGDTLAEDIFLEDTRYPYNAVCLEESWLCQIDRQKFIRLLEENPEAMVSLLSALSRKLYHTKRRMEILFEGDAEVRTAMFLYERTGRLHSQEMALTVNEIAGSINLRRETVSRKIHSLQERGLIERVGQSGLAIKDRQKLKAFIDGAHEGLADGRISEEKE